jgi:hypothetical protein
MRRFGANNGINSDDYQIAVRPLGEQRTEGRVSRESAIPIWLAVNVHGAKELRQARGSQQSLDRDVLPSVPQRGPTQPGIRAAKTHFDVKPFLF